MGKMNCGRSAVQTITTGSAAQSRPANCDRSVTRSLQKLGRLSVCLVDLMMKKNRTLWPFQNMTSPKYDENQDLCIVSKYLPTKYFQWRRNLAVTALNTWARFPSQEQDLSTSRTPWDDALRKAHHHFWPNYITSIQPGKHVWQTQLEGHLTKWRPSILKKCYCHERQGKCDALFPVGGHYGNNEY